LYFGGVVGVANSGGTILVKGVKVKGSLSFGDITTNRFLLVGGLFGENWNATITIENCASEIDITINSIAQGNSGEFLGIGGFMGKSSQGGTGAVTIKNSYSTGNVSVTFNGNKPIFAGGLIGILQASANTIENCYASGNVIVNNTATTITSTHENGTLAAGGLVGYISNAGTKIIKNSAAVGGKAIAAYAGTITAANYGTGRLTGLDKKPATYTDNIALKGMLTGSAIAGAPDNSDGALNTSAGFGKTPDELLLPETWGAGGLGWDTDIWDLQNGSFPTLKNRDHTM
jgi:hypothetical protein